MYFKKLKLKEKKIKLCAVFFEKQGDSNFCLILTTNVIAFHDINLN